MTTRRSFLKKSAAALTAIAAPLSTSLPRVSRPRRAQRVLIIGAGMAGLSAAYELSRLGHEVLVFEAKMTPGGRVHTLRDPFADGLLAEAGAMFVPSGGRAAEYARQLELPLVDMPPLRRDGGRAVFIAGTRVVIRSGQPVQWPVALNADERGLSLRELQNRYHYSRLLELDGLTGNDWPRAEHLRLDIPLSDFWRANGASEGAVRIMRITYFDQVGEGIESVSALHLARELQFLRRSQTFHQIRGGNDLLPRALAARLGEAVRYGAPVVSIRQDANGVEITVEERSGRQQVRGDRLLVTLPPHLVAEIDVRPAFPERRRRALREIRPTSVTRTFVQFRKRFWEDEALDGTAPTELDIQQIHHTTVAQPGTRGILESYTTGERSRRLSAMSPDERLDAVIRGMATVYPAAPQHIEGGTSYAWDRDPWARGDYAWFRPGQVREFFPWIREPEGRIHFAGDVIGGYPGYMDSALDSARDAVTAIDEASGSGEWEWGVGVGVSSTPHPPPPLPLTSAAPESAARPRSGCAARHPVGAAAPYRRCASEPGRLAAPIRSGQ